MDHPTSRHFKPGGLGALGDDQLEMMASVVVR